MTRKFLFDTARFFAQHWYALALITLPIMVPLSVFDTVYYQNLPPTAPELAYYWPLGLDFLIYPIPAAATILYIVSTIRGEPITTVSAWRAGFAYWRQYVVLYVLLTLVIVFGFALLIVPGLILAVRLCMSEIELLLRGTNPVDSMKSSWNITGNDFWLLFRGLLILGLLTLIPSFLYLLAPEEPNLLTNVLEVLVSALESLVLPLMTIFIYRVYDYRQQSG